MCSLGICIALWSVLHEPDRTPLVSPDWTEVFSHSPRRGAQDAAVSILVFSDFTCVACRRWATGAMREVEESLVRKGLVSVSYRHFLVNVGALGPGHPAVAANCAGEQGAFWLAHDILYEQPPESLPALLPGLDASKFRRCLDSAAAARAVLVDHRLGESLGIVATPTAYFALQRDGAFYPMDRSVGAMNYADLLGLLEGLLSEAQQPSAALLEFPREVPRDVRRAQQ